ncbi:MAG: hypothetical protein M1834_007814 [Cirrosporium novae-zelandiae]|nr:MAG: hypothetical protein M1834_007814 [Cirrosporium novae-zelandiae]
MENILTFDGTNAQPTKRRKALRACNRCRISKRRCTFAGDGITCDRCHREGVICSFQNHQSARGPQKNKPSDVEGEGNSHPPYYPVQNEIGSASTQPLTTNKKPLGASSFTEANGSLSSTFCRTNSARTSPMQSQSSQQHASLSIDGSPRRDQNLPPDKPDQNAEPQVQYSSNAAASNYPSPLSPPPDHEARYSTMLHLLEGNEKPKRSKTNDWQRLKFIGDTNPLLGLLHKDLKCKIVNSLCTFRTPDPPIEPKKPVPFRSAGVSGWDWEQSYSASPLDRVRFEYLKGLGCFNMPSREICGGLLETFFSHVHPMLPVLDRKDFLARYYGLDEPPPLVLITAILLAAARYASPSMNIVGSRTKNRNGHDNPDDDGSQTSTKSPMEIREQCDILYNRVRALVDTDVTTQRMAVMQACILASLHWEKREGVNSSLDSLGLAIRIGQEMGLHRRVDGILSSSQDLAGQHLSRRIWWCMYALDRFNAAQEGAPLLINEDDCDIESITDDDFTDEDSITRLTATFNISLAIIIEKAIRKLYAVRNTSADLQCMIYTRDQLGDALDNLEQQIQTFFSGEISTTANKPQNNPRASTTGSEVHRLWSSLLLTHLNAARILIHRPFLTSPSTGAGGLTSRIISRKYAYTIISLLQTMRMRSLLRFAWPFTVYAVVSAMLIIWYDLSSLLPTILPLETSDSPRKFFIEIISLLRDLGDTWWAAAAKKCLGEALLKVVDGLTAANAIRNGASDSRVSRSGKREMVNQCQKTISSHNQNSCNVYDHSLTAQSLGGVNDVATFADPNQQVPLDLSEPLFSPPDAGPSSQQEQPFESDMNVDQSFLNAYEENLTYWASLGLDFETEVMGGIYGLTQ